MKNYESRFEQTGKLFELEAGGRPINTDSPEYQTALREYIKQLDQAALKGRTEHERVKKEGGFELVKKCQPREHDPTNPKGYFAMDIRIKLQDLLKLPAEEWDNIKYYIARGEPRTTPVDKMGVDDFIEYEDKKNDKTYRITIDFTVRPQKLEHEADIIVFNKDLGDPGDEGYHDNISRYGNLVLEKISEDIDNLLK